MFVSFDIHLCNESTEPREQVHAGRAGSATLCTRAPGQRTARCLSILVSNHSHFRESVRAGVDGECIQAESLEQLVGDASRIPDCERHTQQRQQYHVVQTCSTRDDGHAARVL